MRTCDCRAIDAGVSCEGRVGGLVIDEEWKGFGFHIVEWSKRDGKAQEGYTMRMTVQYCTNQGPRSAAD